MGKSGNQDIGNNERLFEEKRNRVYTIHGGDYKRKSNPDPHTNLIFDASSRPVMLDLLRSRSST